MVDLQRGTSHLMMHSVSSDENFMMNNNNNNAPYHGKQSPHAGNGNLFNIGKSRSDDEPVAPLGQSGKGKYANFAFRDLEQGLKEKAQHREDGHSTTTPSPNDIGVSAQTTMDFGNFDGTISHSPSSENGKRRISEESQSTAAGASSGYGSFETTPMSQSSQKMSPQHAPRPVPKQRLQLVSQCSKGLLLTEYQAPWPTSATCLRSPKYVLSEYKDRLDFLIREYFRSGDFTELTDQLWQLRSETYNDSLVARVFRLGMDQRGEQGLAKHPHSWENCLIGLMKEDMVSSAELMRGIYGFISFIQDLELDVPHASEKIIHFFEMLVSEELADETIFFRLPENILMRGKPGVQKQLHEYKRIISHSLDDFFATQSVARLEQTIRDVNMPLFAHELIKRAILCSFDHGATEQQAVVRMIQNFMRKGVVTDEDIQHGLALVVGRLDDVILDVPYAKKYCAEIFTECVTNELLSADLVKKEQQLEYGGIHGIELCTSVLHKTPEYSRKIWSGAGDEKGLLAEMDLAIEEYFDSLDCEEVARIVGELHLNREFEIKFIRKILLSSIEKRDVHTGLNLIAYLQDIYWSTQQIEDAVETIRADVDDLLIDMPDIAEATSYVVDQAYRYQLVSEDFMRMDQHYLV
jgi:hypothetical protein